MRVAISDEFVRRARTDGPRAPIFRDADVIGFGVQVRPSGCKSFTLD